MPAQFLHISFKFVVRANHERLKETFDLALDWMHYLPGCWIVKTTSSAQKWYERLKPVISPDDSLLIIKIQLDERQGWLPEWVWEWLRKHKREISSY